MYNVNLEIDEFHLIFGTLQDKILANKKEIENLPVRYENLIYPVIIDENRHQELLKQNSKLEALLKKLYDDTNGQLKSKE